MSGPRAASGTPRVELALAEADINKWYRQFGEAVFRRCQRLLRDEALAMDLMQETFLRAYKYQRSYRGPSPLPWLLTIADRCSLDALQRRVEPIEPEEVRRFLEEEEAPVQPPFTSYGLIPKLLAQADDLSRQVVLHRYFDELELEEIAGKLNINERTVRRRLERFLDSARRLLERS